MLEGGELKLPLALRNCGARVRCMRNGAAGHGVVFPNTPQETHVLIGSGLPKTGQHTSPLEESSCRARSMFLTILHGKQDAKPFLGMRLEG